ARAAASRALVPGSREQPRPRGPGPCRLGRDVASAGPCCPPAAMRGTAEALPPQPPTPSPRSPSSRPTRRSPLPPCRARCQLCPLQPRHPLEGREREKRLPELSPEKFSLP
ncbi:hypothetical protein P7K49_023198, partial [Saguinus oedipus]